MTKIVPLTLACFAGCSCKKENTGCKTATGWPIEINGEPLLRVIASNLPDQFKVSQKRISFVKGKKPDNSCPPQMSYRADRYGLKQVTDN